MNAPPTLGKLRCCVWLFAALQLSEKAFPQPARLFLKGMEAILELIKSSMPGATPPDTDAAHKEILTFRTIPLLLQFLAACPVTESAYVSGCRLMSLFIVHHPALSQEFLDLNGLKTLFVDKKGLSSPESYVGEFIVMLSNIARTSKEYYHQIHQIDAHQKLYTQIADLLKSHDADVRSKTCNMVGNLSRHSDYFYLHLRPHVLPALIPLLGDSDPLCKRFASFAIGNSAFHSNKLYQDLLAAVPFLVGLLRDPDERTRANAAGALGNLVRNSNDLCPDLVRYNVPSGLLNAIIRGSELPQKEFLADSCVKIALFSLGNLAVHKVCRDNLLMHKTNNLCEKWMNGLPKESVIYKHCERLLRKLGE